MNALVLKDYRSIESTSRLTKRWVIIFASMPNLSITKFIANILKQRLLKKVYKQWDILNVAVEDIQTCMDNLSQEDLIKVHTGISKIIDLTIGVDESFADLGVFTNDVKYKERLKTTLKKLNRVNNKLHFKLTKDNPIQETSEEMRSVLSKLSGHDAA